MTAEGAKRADPGEPTMTASSTVVRPPDPPSAVPPERVRVALVAGSGSVATDDLYLLLLRRLRVSILIIAAGLAVLFGATLLALATLIQSGRIQEPGVYLYAWWTTPLRALVTIVAAIMALLLWRSPPSSVRGLRGIEVIVIGVWAAILSADDIVGYEFLLQVTEGETRLERQLSAALGMRTQTLFWLMLITWYGALIPNTWRRATAVVGGLTLTPLVLFALQALWLRPLPAELGAGWLLFSYALFLGVGAAIAIFSSSRIEILRRQAAEARKLGQYILKEKLGAGGMGEVYRAEHVLLRRPCALKLIRPERAGDPKNLRRFEREVQVTATLTHPNTIQIYDYGRADDGTFYYVMEYLPGLTLEQLVKQRGPLPPDRVVHLFRQLCGALREAHAAGLIHRDIKPSNVIVCERGGLHDVAKLLDFGIVDTLTPDRGEQITAHGQLLGTPAYMSAEQAAASADLDARSDLYSLGATAYFALTGRPPFDHPTINLILAAQLRDAATPPHLVRTRIPADLSGVIVRCLEKDPAARYPDAAALDAALAGCACAGGWTEGRAVQAAADPPKDEDVNLLSTKELERRWGI